jgi:hypothetical protein
MDARQLASDGARRAVEHANRELFGWEDEAVGWVRKVVKDTPIVTASLVRMTATNGGLPDAPDRRAWGAVMKRAAKEGIIRATEAFTSTRLRTSHGRPERVWERA